VYIEGQLRTRSWDQNGEKKYTTEVVLSGFNSALQMLNKVTGEPKGEPEIGDLDVVEKIQPVDTDDFEDEDIPF
jgi:single-strand DNA-binding protein